MPDNGTHKFLIKLRLKGKRGGMMACFMCHRTSQKKVYVCMYNVYTYVLDYIFLNHLDLLRLDGIH